jgi:hypothetical protein
MTHTERLNEDEAELKDIRKDIDDTKHTNPKAYEKQENELEKVDTQIKKSHMMIHKLKER